VEVGVVNFTYFVSKLWQSYLALGTLTYFFFYIWRVFLTEGYGLTTGATFLPVFKVLLSGFGKEEVLILLASFFFCNIGGALTYLTADSSSERIMISLGFF
jgi:hypothetical protein